MEQAMAGADGRPWICRNSEGSYYHRGDGGFYDLPTGIADSPSDWEAMHVL
jgi:hypothetical protein